MQLIAITHTVPQVNEAAIINQLFTAGLPRLHVRRPAATEIEIDQLLQQIEHVWHPQISLHSCHQLVHRYQIGGLHYTEAMRAGSNATEWQSCKSSGYTLSTSVHQLPLPAHLSGYFSYAFYGPVFNSISKPGYQQAISDNFYLEEVQKSIPLIALGGITAGNFSQVKAMNFDGAALLGSLWQQPAKAPQLIASLLSHCQ